MPKQEMCSVCRIAFANYALRDLKTNVRTWFCQSHVPRDEFTMVGQTFLSMFEEAFLKQKNETPSTVSSGEGVGRCPF